MVTKPKSERIPTQNYALFDLSEQPPLDVRKTFSHTRAGNAGGAALAGPAVFSQGEAERTGPKVTEFDPDSLTFRTRRAAGVPALYISLFDRAEEWEREFLAGAKMLGFDPTPQQWKIADAINAHDEYDEPLYSTIGVCVPRRAGKTTALLAVALGRAKCRDNYVVLFTAQSGTKARDRFLSMAGTLERLQPNEYERGFKVLKGAGHQVIEFTNGAFFQVVPPKGESFRGDAGDLLIVDEAQEHGADMSADLLSGILPTMDTRPGAQFIVAGTAGEHRSGLFWDTLEEGRTGVDGTGIIEFAAPQDTSVDQLKKPNGEKDWDGARPIIEAAHPGIGTLTRLDVVKKRFLKLPFPQFMREYLGIWPEDYSKSAIDSVKWTACGLEEFTRKPAHFAIGFDVNPNGSSAAIAAAWREDGHSYVEILEHNPGTDWLVPALAKLSKKYRVSIGHDTVGAVLVEAEALARQRPAPRRKPIGYKDVGAMCASFMKEITNERLRHFKQSPLNSAVAGVVKRDLGDNAWAWGRRQSDGTDIAPLVAANIALRTYDTIEKRGNTRIISPHSLAKKAA